MSEVTEVSPQDAQVVIANLMKDPAIKDQSDFKEWLQAKADKLARADTKLAGMEIDNG